MSQKNENWIHLFQILNIGKHKDGFTLYEVTSMVYPKSCPDAITKLVVWKRFNDFKYLYNEMKKRVKSSSINERIPKLPKSSYFKRFSEQVIEVRRQSCLSLLECIAKYPMLFTSDCFVKFFESSYVPAHQIKGNIDAIRDELHLPKPPDIVSVNSLSSEDDRTIYSDTDSISTRSNLSLVSSQITDTYSTESLLSPTSQKVDTSNLEEYETFIQKCPKTVYSESNLPSIPEITETKSKFGSNLTTSLSWQELSSSQYKDKPEMHYMLEAAEHISKAAEYESCKNYEQAFASYKLGISSLLNGAKNDPDLDRKESVRHKVAKYLLKAEKIYNIHLNLDIEEQNWNANISKKIADSLKVERPLTELTNIKVIDIMSSVMVVTCGSQSDIYVIKVIHKIVSDTAFHDVPILPYNIPFMVKLYKYYCTEHSVYALLQYARGGLLWNYFKSNREKSDGQISTKPENVPELINESESDDSYLQLIQDYCAKELDDSSDKENINNNTAYKTNSDCSESDLNCFEAATIIPEDTKNLLKNAQELLDSVSGLLEKNKQKVQLPLESLSLNDTIESLSCSDSQNVSQSTTGDDSVECWSEECVKQWERLPESIIVKYASQLVMALEALHRLGIICYDLQPKNLLLDVNGDLLLSFMYQWENLDVNRFFEYPDIMYTAPEIRTVAPVTKAADWWSFGVILYEMLTGLKFYLCHPGGFTSTSILNIPKYVSTKAESLLTELLVYVPEDRLGYGINGADKIKSHSFFESVDWQKLSHRH